MESQINGATLFMESNGEILLKGKMTWSNGNKHSKSCLFRFFLASMCDLFFLDVRKTSVTGASSGEKRGKRSESDLSRFCNLLTCFREERVRGILVYMTHFRRGACRGRSEIPYFCSFFHCQGSMFWENIFCMPFILIFAL